MSKKLDDISNLAVSKFFDDNENMWVDAESFNDLLAHARALEEMLRKHEWCIYDQRLGLDYCPECGHPKHVPEWLRMDEPKAQGHAPDCALAKLLE